MNKIIKNKKGSAVIESLILLPILIYLIFFTAMRIFSYTVYAETYKSVTTLVREVSVCKTSKDMLNQIAAKVFDDTKENNMKTSYEITKIKLSSQVGVDTSEVSFTTKDSANGRFLDYVSKDSNGQGKFNYVSWQTSQKEAIEKLWQKHPIIEITVETDILSNDFFNLYVYNVETGERVKTSFMIDPKIKVSATYVISF